MSDNFVQSFQLESSHIRGRIVRLGSVLDDILNAHKTYPEDVLHLTGEMLTLCIMLSSMLKYDGIFTLQAKGDGPVSMLVADVVNGSKIRACAGFKPERLAAESHKGNPAALLGSGHLAFTVDQGEHMERYQGIVELKPESLIASVQHYFSQSEQIGTGMVMTVGRRDGVWRATGIMVQQMPEETAEYNKDQSNIHEDDWRRTMVLLSSVKDEEMLDKGLSASDLLFRLFHEEGVRIFEEQTLENKCRCSPERVENILTGMSNADIDEMVVDGKIVMTCEFCSRDYVFDPAEFKKKETTHNEKTLLSAVALGVLAVAGCTNITASPAPQLSFENYAPQSLNVASVSVEDAYIMPNDNQDVSGQFVVSPADAVKRYAAKRFQARGAGNGFFTIGIEDARVHFRQIDQENKTLKWADIGKEDEYRVFLQLRVTPQPDGFNGRMGPTTIKMERTLIMKSGVTLEEREDKQIAFLEKLIADVDAKIQTALDSTPAIR